MSKPPKTHNSAGRLQGYVDRIQRLDEEIKALNADKSDIYREVKGAGYDPGAVRTAIKFLADPQAAVERTAIVNSVLEALGWDEGRRQELVGTPEKKPATDLEGQDGRPHAQVHVHEGAAEPAEDAA